MNSSEPGLKLSTTQWLVCIIAAIGFAFDIYELLMLPLIIKPAMATLSAPLIEQAVAGGMPRPEAVALWLPGGAKYVEWARILFLYLRWWAVFLVCWAVILPICWAVGAC